MLLDFLKNKHVPVGCFGKLPIYADFIKLRSENMEMSMFDNWLQEGLQLARTKLENNFKERYQRFLHYNFIYQPKNSGKAVTGVLFPGMDKGGRYFPFVIFILMDKQQLDIHLGSLLSCLQDTFFPDAASIGTSGWAGLDPAEFLKKYFDKEVSINPDKQHQETYHNFIRRETVGSYFGSLAGDITEAKRQLIFRNLLDTVSHLTKDNFQRFSLGIKFPLSPGHGRVGLENMFWIEMIQRVFPFRKIFPSLFWSNGENETVSSLYFYLNEPQPKHFLSLLNTDSDLDDGVCDLPEMRSAMTNDTGAFTGENYYQVLKNPNATLYELLNAI